MSQLLLLVRRKCVSGRAMLQLLLLVRRKCVSGRAWGSIEYGLGGILNICESLETLLGIWNIKVILGEYWIPQ